MIKSNPKGTSFISRGMLLFIKAYRYFISPMLGKTCRFYPSCSSYGRTAIERYGALRGGWMTIWRILRCNPWNSGGYDPVPDKLHFCDKTLLDGIGKCDKQSHTQND